MTYQQWQVSADALAMLDFLFPMHGTGSSQEQPRKLRLYYCALARQVWHALPAAMRATVLALEYLVDAPTDQTVLLNQLREISNNYHGFEGNPDDLREWEQSLARIGFTAEPPTLCRAWNAFDANKLAVLVSLGCQPEAQHFRWVPAYFHRADYVRDIFEYDVFDPSSFDSNWHTPAIIEQCDQMYKSHDFSDMPALADKLEEAGCQSESILEHCRDPHGMHARGCWVIDRICMTDKKMR
ncbi:MAG: hypothetical protein U0798_04390 [Gemmataceae bacterium]